MQTQLNRRANAGFTLMEMMIIVVVIGILMAVALPGYQNAMIKSRRADGMRALMELASRQERFYAQNSTYSDNISDDEGLDFGSTTTPEEHYSLRLDQCVISSDDEDEEGEVLGWDRCYRLEADPRGEQVKDTQCATLSINARGERTATGTLGTDCW